MYVHRNIKILCDGEYIKKKKCAGSYLMFITLFIMRMYIKEKTLSHEKLITWYMRVQYRQSDVNDVCILHNVNINRRLRDKLEL